MDESGMHEPDSRFWAVIPAAGVGQRMGAEIPKQYLPLGARTVLEHTLDRFCTHPRISGVVVAVAGNDTRWESLHVSCDRPLFWIEGGLERAHSVLNALEHLAGMTSLRDWVLIHDAARPCLRSQDIDRLIATLTEHPVGGLLGVPVRDTMKRADDAAQVLATVERDQLWHALTPQMFRLGMLREALNTAIGNGLAVTDEAAAMELAGHNPLLVAGSADNIKITRPEDLQLAEFFLERQQAQGYIALDDGQ